MMGMDEEDLRGRQGYMSKTIPDSQRWHKKGKNKFNAGNKAMVRPDLYMYSTNLNDTMMSKSGDIVTIKEVAYKYYYLEEVGWSWEEWMLQPVAQSEEEWLKMLVQQKITPQQYEEYVATREGG